MSNPLVSVVLPFHNSAATLEEAARSVLRQTVRDLELILIDDASSDESYEVARRIRDPRVRLCRNERNLGVSRTRNRGLEMMRGEFMAPMDADDVCCRRRLERTLAQLRRCPSLGVCGGWARWLGWGTVPFVNRLICGTDAVRAFLLYGAPFHHDTLLCRGDLVRLHQRRYPDDRLASDDLVFYRRCAEVTDADNIPEVLVRYRCSPGGLSNTRAREATDVRLEGLHEELLKLFPGGVDGTTLRFHARVGNGVGASNLGELDTCGRWLDTIERANRERCAYDSEGLARATARVWFLACRNSAHLGWVAWRAWRRSRWAGWHRPAAVELLSFAGSGALAWGMPSRRRPQGGLAGL